MYTSNSQICNNIFLLLNRLLLIVYDKNVKRLSLNETVAKKFCLIKLCLFGGGGGGLGVVYESNCLNSFTKT